MKITIEIDKNNIEETLHRVRDFKDNFIQLAVEEKSWDDLPEDFLHQLKTFEIVDNLILKIKKEADND